MGEPDFSAYDSITDCPIKMPWFGLRIIVGVDDGGAVHTGYQLDGTGPAYTIVGALEYAKLSIFHDLEHEVDE